MPIKFMLFLLVAMCGYANANSYIIQFASDGVVSHNIKDSDATNNVCGITFSDMSAYHRYGSALGMIRIIDGDNKSIPFGELSFSSPTKAIFANATVTSSATWSNDDYYFVSYAIAGYEGLKLGKYYWLGVGSSTYSIKFNQPKSVMGISLSDLPSNDDGAKRGVNGDYKVTISDCENNVIKTILTPKVSSEIVGSIGFIDITK